VRESAAFYPLLVQRDPCRDIGHTVIPSLSEKSNSTPQRFLPI